MLKSIEIRNFRSFKEAKLDLGLRNVLVGPNMSGKSNLIEVFRLLRRLAHPASGNMPLSSAFLGGFQESTWKGDNSRTIAIALAGIDLVGSERTQWRYELKLVGDQWGSARVENRSEERRVGEESRSRWSPDH